MYAKLGSLPKYQYFSMKPNKFKGAINLCNSSNLKTKSSEIVYMNRYEAKEALKMHKIGHIEVQVFAPTLLRLFLIFQCFCMTFLE